MPRIYTDPTPSLSTVEAAAKAAVAALKKLGLRSYLVGGYACYLHGNSREPNDMDLVVSASSETRSQEQLKLDLVNTDPSFYTVASRNPYASYRVLWYRPSSYATPCKVDLLLLGIMNIPSVPSSKIQQINLLPVAPLSLVFLLKLQAWEDYSQAAKEYLRVKQHTDVRDIDRLTTRLVERWGKEFVRECSSWMPSPFVAEARRRVKKYCMSFPSTRSNWEALGFQIRTEIGRASCRERVSQLV